VGAAEVVGIVAEGGIVDQVVEEVGDGLDDVAHRPARPGEL
jgi:hypothetical protein